MEYRAFFNQVGLSHGIRVSVRIFVSSYVSHVNRRKLLRLYRGSSSLAQLGFPQNTAPFNSDETFR